MSFVTAAIVGGIGAVGAAAVGAVGSYEASKQQQAGLQSALQQNQQFFGQSQAALEPFIQTGQNAAPILQALATPGPNQNALLSQTPGFQFSNYWGNQAVRNQGTTMGLGGNTLAAASQFATGNAQQYFQQDINPLLSLYQGGIQAGGALSGAASNAGNAAVGAATGIGQAQAAGTLGIANAFGGGIGNAANAYGNYALLSRLGGVGAGGMYGSGALGGQPDLGYANYNNGVPTGIQGVAPFAPS